ncbi:hypothetical protein VP1G_03712 [Cytospora mali]|uniref:2EXR domain-containing protein n=1 Tax=Cytospora mali TaxID=578113 RepID=A0A194UXL9_CYTMA|nr:hypothetical protein VP1G_03712 [Valsa mali var. pyri (nom. inval.)]
MADDQNNDEHPLSGSAHDDDSESQESSSDEEPNGGLFDIEASEDDSEAAHEDQDGLDYDGGDYSEPFPQFMQLPPELREMVWKDFCPDLTERARVFAMYLLDSPFANLVPGPELESQTAPMRAILAIHRETRAIGLKSSPHTFRFPTGEVIRYHEETDVINFIVPRHCDEYTVLDAIQYLGGSAQNMAFSFERLQLNIGDICYILPHLKRIFLLFEDSDWYRRGEDIEQYAWAISENVHHYYIETQEEGEAGLQNTVKRLFCWPDIDNHRDFAEMTVEKQDENPTLLGVTIQSCRELVADPRGMSEELSLEDATAEEQEETIARIKNIEVWPMIQFNDDSGVQLFNDMKEWKQPWDAWDFYPSDSSDGEDAYDSYGIDDEFISDHLSTDDEDDLPGLLLVDNSSEPDTLGHIFDVSDSEINGHPAAQFSSDDEEEAENQGSHADASGAADEDDEEEVEEDPRNRTSRPKRRVVESDSEDESATDTKEPRRPANRRARPALADSEDDSDEEEEDPSPRPAQRRDRRARALPSDSEDEDDEDGDEDDVPQPSRGTKNRRARALPANSDDDEDEDTSDGEEDDDEPAPPKRMSLAQRLMMEAKGARSGHRGGDDSDADGIEFGAASDDDDDDGDAGLSRDGMDMAEDYDGEGGESEEDY